MKKKFYRLHFNGSTCTYATMDDVVGEIEYLLIEFDNESVLGKETIAVEIIQMTQEEFEALPEFAGW